MIFYGKEVSDTGCEILVKVGSRFADPSHPKHTTSWRDGQIGDIRPLGFHTGKQVGYCCTLLRFPNIDYTTIGGRWQEDWKKVPAEMTLWDKINHTVNINGRYEWEVADPHNFESVRQTRDYFLDFLDLENKKLITKSEKENIYNYDNKTIITIPQLHNLETILKHEEVDGRLDPSKLLQHASITEGTHSIGSGLDYDTVTAFELAIGATLTGDLTGEHANEETAISTAILFAFDSATYLFKLTAASGAEHNGGAYGNGARIDYSNSDYIALNDDNIENAEISKLALAANAINDKGIALLNCGTGSGLVTVNRMLVAGSSGSWAGIQIEKGADNVRVTNNIIYAMGTGANEGGIIIMDSIYATNVYEISNNTVIGCANGIKMVTTDVDPAITLKNNLVQASGTADYVDNASNWASNGYNVSEDATGPDAAYDNTDVHTNSVFQDYAADDFRLDSAGDATNLAILDDGEDLSGTFTDDIQGQTRSTWYIGASEIVAAGGNAPTGTIFGSLFGPLKGLL